MSGPKAYRSACPSRLSPNMEHAPETGCVCSSSLAGRLLDEPREDCPAHGVVQPTCRYCGQALPRGRVPLTCELEILDPTGHVTLEWSPDDPESVEKARAEFERLTAAGFAFFTTSEEVAESIEPGDGLLLAKLQPKLEQTREFRPRRRRTTAVPPMRGG